MDVSKIERNETIAARIAEGVTAQNTALETVRAAALEFAQLIPWDYESKDIPAIVKQGRSLYAEDFAGNNNLAAWFGDVATLALASDAPISFETQKIVKGQKVKEEVHTTAADATQLSKHALKAAASAAREDMGIGRAKGAGRVPETPTSAPAQQVFSTTEMKSQLAGLFGHSKSPQTVLNKLLAEYRCAVISAADAEAFAAWKKANTKAAK